MRKRSRGVRSVQSSTPVHVHVLASFSSTSSTINPVHIRSSLLASATARHKLLPTSKQPQMSITTSTTNVMLKPSPSPPVNCRASVKTTILLGTTHTALTTVTSQSSNEAITSTIAPRLQTYVMTSPSVATKVSVDTTTMQMQGIPRYTSSAMPTKNQKKSLTAAEIVEIISITAGTVGGAIFVIMAVCSICMYLRNCPKRVRTVTPLEMEKILQTRKHTFKHSAVHQNYLNDK